GPAGDERRLQFAADVDRRPDVFERSGHQDADGVDLVDRSVRRIAPPIAPIEQHFALNIARQALGKLVTLGARTNDLWWNRHVHDEYRVPRIDKNFSTMRRPP